MLSQSLGKETFVKTMLFCIVFCIYRGSLLATLLAKRQKPAYWNRESVNLLHPELKLETCSNFFTQVHKARLYLRAFQNTHRCLACIGCHKGKESTWSLSPRSSPCVVGWIVSLPLPPIPIYPEPQNVADVEMCDVPAGLEWVLNPMEVSFEELEKTHRDKEEGSGNME